MRLQGVRLHRRGAGHGHVERQVLPALMTRDVEKNSARDEKDHEHRDDDESASSAHAFPPLSLRVDDRFGCALREEGLAG